MNHVTPCSSSEVHCDWIFRFLFQCPALPSRIIAEIRMYANFKGCFESEKFNSMEDLMSVELKGGVEKMEAWFTAVDGVLLAMF
jgi:hypothetical protein